MKQQNKEYTYTGPPVEHPADAILLQALLKEFEQLSGKANGFFEIDSDHSKLSNLNYRLRYYEPYGDTESRLFETWTVTFPDLLTEAIIFLKKITK